MAESNQSYSKRFGPGMLVTAAFIGPGTVTTASLAGASFGFVLLWAILFSVIATMVLQEMAARLGIVTGFGLGEAIRVAFRNRFSRFASIALVVSAIGIGNAAFQAGNIIGGATGAAATEAQFNVQIPKKIERAEYVTAKTPFWALMIGLVAILFLLSGELRHLQSMLVFLVGLMSIAFLIAAVVSQPDISQILTCLFVPRFPEGSLTKIIGLIGTTVVGYNLFLHATASSENWQGQERKKALRQSRIDTTVSVGLGGIITSAILVTASVAFHGNEKELTELSQVSTQLEPAIGRFSQTLFGCGLLAAGLTSAITAPLAAGFALAGCFGWKKSIDDLRFRIVVVVVALIGLTFAMVTQSSPSAVILFAQVANGLLLPLIAVFLIIVMNNRRVLGDYRNGWLANGLGGIAVAIASGLGIWKLVQVALKVIEYLSSVFVVSA